jgi:hypothetical protein
MGRFEHAPRHPVAISDVAVRAVSGTALLLGNFSTLASHTGHQFALGLQLACVVQFRLRAVLNTPTFVGLACSATPPRTRKKCSNSQSTAKWCPFLARQRFSRLIGL